MFLITSKFQHYTKNADGERIPCVIPDENGILSLIKQHLTGQENLLLIANDPADSELNDRVAAVLARAFALTGIKFKQVNVLDRRTSDQTTTLIKQADLIFIAGGEVLRQLLFLQRINFKQAIKGYAGVVITASASSMCLTKTICNFPEHTAELAQPRYLDGLGVIDVRLIPHFDGATLTYQGTTDFSNLVQDYLLPYSDDGEVCGLPNGSFIAYDGTTLKYHGRHYRLLHRECIAVI